MSPPRRSEAATGNRTVRGGVVRANDWRDSLHARKKGQEKFLALLFTVMFSSNPVYLKDKLKVENVTLCDLYPCLYPCLFRDHHTDHDGACH